MLDYQLNKLESKAEQYEQKAVKISLSFFDPVTLGIIGTVAAWSMIGVPLLNSTIKEFSKSDIEKNSIELITKLNEYEKEYTFKGQEANKNKLVESLKEVHQLVGKMKEVLVSGSEKDAEIIEKFKDAASKFGVYSEVIRGYINDNLSVGTKALKAVQILTGEWSFTLSQKIMELIDSLNQSLRLIVSNLEAKEMELKEKLMAQSKAKLTAPSKPADTVKPTTPVAKPPAAQTVAPQETESLDEITLDEESPKQALNDQLSNLAA